MGSESSTTAIACQFASYEGRCNNRTRIKSKALNGNNTLRPMPPSSPVGMIGQNAVPGILLEGAVLPTVAAAKQIPLLQIFCHFRPKAAARGEFLCQILDAATGGSWAQRRLTFTLGSVRRIFSPTPPVKSTRASQTLPPWMCS